MAPKKAPAEAKARGRRPSAVDLLQRNLSFAECSVDQIGLAVLAEDPSTKFDAPFWCTLLTGTPPEEFRSLQNRTLGFWIQAFNRWQECGGWTPGKAPELVDGDALNKILRVPPNKCIEIIKLFDPVGHRRLSGASGGEALKKCKIRICELMMAGVVLSRLIATKQKLKFILGLFDVDDSRSLDESEFACFVSAFIHGLGAAFGLRKDDDIMPTTKQIQLVVQRLYDRLGAIAKARICALAEALVGNERQALAEAIRSHQLDKVSLNRTSSKPRRQVLPFETLIGWCFREYQDPLALPYALSIERFCPKLQPLDEDPEAFLEEEKRFYLSHKGPVPLPMESTVAHDASMLTRKEVILAREVFRFCLQEGTFQMSHSELQEGLRREDLTAQLWSKLQSAMERINDERSRGIKVDIFSFLRKLHPGAQPMHLRMFDGWMQQFDQMKEQKKFVEACEQSVQSLHHTSTLPVIPDLELAELERQFKSIDLENSGLITLQQIERAMSLDCEVLRKYDVSNDGFIDFHEFVAMMCPTEYRPPEMCGFDQEVLGSLVKMRAARMRSGLDQQVALYESPADAKAEGVRKSEMPASMRPEVPEETWAAWNSVFDRVDNDGDNTISDAELRSSMLLSQDVCEQLIASTRAEGKLGIPRRDFLLSLLDFYKCRRPAFVMMKET